MGISVYLLNNCLLSIFIFLFFSIVTNSYYDTEADCVYVPLVCLRCWSNVPRVKELVGFEVKTFTTEVV